MPEVRAFFERAPFGADDGSPEACSVCSAHLGLAAPSISAPAKAWLCGRCGAAYFAIPANKELRPRCSSARPVVYQEVITAATIAPTAGRRPVPHGDLQRVLQFLATADHQGAEKRRERRHAVAMPVLAMPISRNFRVSGPAVELTTLNISRGGASLIHPTLSDAAYIAIDFSYAGLGMVQALLEVLRVRPFLSAHEVAGRWHCRINPFNFVAPGAPQPATT